MFCFCFYVFCFIFIFMFFCYTCFMQHVLYVCFCLAMFLETRALCSFLCFFMFMFFCYTCFMFVFLTLTIPRSLYFSECEILTALPNYWAPSFLSESHGR